MPFKNNYYKRFRIMILCMALLMVFVACSSNVPKNIKEIDDTNTSDNTDIVDNTSPTPKPDVQDTDNNEPNQNSEEVTGSDTNKSEDILKDYSYSIIDQPIEDFELEDLAGNLVKLSDFKGKIVFLNFWATWCPPCKEEMPHMQTFYDKYKDDDIVVLAVNPTQVENQGSSDSDKAEKKVREFIDQKSFTFPVLLDKDDSVWAFYQQRGIPANYVIDTEGIIRYLKPGAFISVEEMEAFAEAIRAAEG